MKLNNQEKNKVNLVMEVLKHYNSRKNYKKKSKQKRINQYDKD